MTGNVAKKATTHSIFATAALLIATGMTSAAEVEKVATESGKPVQIGYFAAFHPDCSVSAVPQIRVTMLPKGGAILIQDGTMTTMQVPNCPKLSVPVRQIMYQPGSNFTGEDAVGFDVIDPADGKTVSRSVTIIVGAPATKI